MYYLGEIIMFGGGQVPDGWHLCDGSLLAIKENEALYSLIDTTYGGDGHTTFALPDLRGRVPVGAGQGPGLSVRLLGQRDGADQVTLKEEELAAHSHPIQATSRPGGENSPTSNIFAEALTDLYRAATDPFVEMGQTLVANTKLPGHNHNLTTAPHPNVQPSLVVNFIIAVKGAYPSRT